MPDTLRAMAISGGILFGVVILFTIIIMAAVKRGEAGMHEDEAKHESKGGHH